MIRSRRIPSPYPFVVCAILFGCRASMPIPPPGELAPTIPPPPPSDNPATSVAEIRRMEVACRTRLQEDTLRASRAAIDRVRLALGSVCDVESVGDDPLHWLFRCRADGLFQLGRYDFSNEGAASCVGVQSLHATSVNRWVCAGALLQDARHGLGGLEMAVVGHVDNVRMAPDRSFSPCPELRAAEGYTPSPAWSDVAAGGSPDEHGLGNSQLAWCRAANVAQHIRCGMALALHGGALPAGDPCAHAGAPPPGAPISVVGAGTAWQDAQSANTCAPPPEGSENFAGYCAEARRVDVFVKFVPTQSAVRVSCDRTGSDPATALYCLQDCLEQAAAPTRADRTEDVPLLRPCVTSAAALPRGWYESAVPDATGTCREVDLETVRHTLRLHE